MEFEHFGKTQSPSKVTLFQDSFQFKKAIDISVTWIKTLHQNIVLKPIFILSPHQQFLFESIFSTLFHMVFAFLFEPINRVLVVCKCITYNNWSGCEILKKEVSDAPPSSLVDSFVSPKVQTMEGEGVGAHSLAHNTSRVEGCAQAPGWGLKRLTSNLITYTDLHKPNHKLVNA